MEPIVLVDKIKKMLEQEKMNRRQIYENLLVGGDIKPNSEHLVFEVIEYGLYHKIINPARIIRWNKKRGKLPTIYTTEQLITIFDRVVQPKMAIILWLGLFCGLRIREVCNLKISDVDLLNKKLFVRDSKNTNRFLEGYGKDRIVTIPDIAIPPIKRWLSIIQGGVWFVPCMQSPDRQIRTKTVHEQYRQILKLCGLDEAEYVVEYTARNYGVKKDLKKTMHKYRFHTLRHTYATYLLEKGVPLEHIQKLLGHNQLDTTLVYARVSDKQTKQMVNEAFNMPMKLLNRVSGFNEAKPFQDLAPQIAAREVSAQLESPTEILRKRLARGEIDILTYKRLMAELNPENTVNVIHKLETIHQL